MRREPPLTVVRRDDTPAPGATHTHPPAGRRVKASGIIDAGDVGREHLRDTISGLIGPSELSSDAIAAGTLAVVGANYRLLEGRAVPDVTLGQV